ncbi:MAG: hypothetical protein WC523_04190 [Patescibacteria group bacterium]
MADYKTYKVRVYNDGSKEWYLNGKCHREDGPAIECANGTKEWYINSLHHREDGPACEYANGDKYWYLNGQRHREDGPAIERSDGGKEWYLDGIEYTEEEFLAKTKPATCEGKIVEIDGKKYKLSEV